MSAVANLRNGSATQGTRARRHRHQRHRRLAYRLIWDMIPLRGCACVTESLVSSMVIPAEASLIEIRPNTTEPVSAHRTFQQTRNRKGECSSRTIIGRCPQTAMMVFNNGATY